MGNKSSTTTDETLRMDPWSEAWRRQSLDAGRAALDGMPGVSSTEGYRLSEDLLRQAAGMGGLGMGALGGDMDAIRQLMNPYMQGVLDPLNASYDRARGAAQTNANARATAMGAFGGNRAALTAGQEIADVERARQQQIGGLMYQGFGDAMGRASQLTQLGLGGAGGLQALQDQARMDPYNREMLAAQLFKMYPAGQDRHVRTEQESGWMDTVSGIAGLGLTAAGMAMGGPMGATAAGSVAQSLPGGGAPRPSGFTLQSEPLDQTAPFGGPYNPYRNAGTIPTGRGY